MTFARERLSAAVKAAGCDALVVRDPCFWTYIAGFALPGTLARHLDWIAGPRPCFALVTADGRRTVLVDTFSYDLCRQHLGEGEIERYEAYREQPLDRLAELVRARCGGRPRLAVDRPMQWLWQETRSAPFELVIAETLLWQVMSIKTEAEIDRIRRGCHILDDAFAAVATDKSARCTEASLHARIVAWCLDHGSQFTHGILNVERNDVLYAGESQIEVVPGDMVRTDYVAYFDGYPGHQSRMLVRGRASSEQIERYDRLLDVHRTVIERCRPPMTGSQVHAIIGELFARHGMTYTAKISGHGVGPWMHQQFPILAAGSDDRVECGMVLALEPFVGSWHLQDVILIGADRNVLLSDRLDISRPLEV